MKGLISRIEKFLDMGGTRKDAALLAISGAALLLRWKSNT